MEIFIIFEHPERISIQLVPDVVHVSFIDLKLFKNLSGTPIDAYVTATKTVPL
jgi:hypothetical protein